MHDQKAWCISFNENVHFLRYFIVFKRSPNLEEGFPQSRLRYPGGVQSCREASAGRKSHGEIISSPSAGAHGFVDKYTCCSVFLALHTE